MIKSHDNTEPHWEVHDGSGPYILLVHGILSSRAQWLHNIKALSKNTRPVVVELFGHGRSPSPESAEAYHPDGYAHAFENIRKKLGISDWFVCGQSLGSCLTLNYALKHPDRVVAQIFTNTTAAFSEDKNQLEAKKNGERLALQLMENGTDILKKIPVHPIHARQFKKDIRTALLEDSEQMDRLGIANTFLYTVPKASVRNRIHENRIPTLLICGKQERRFEIFREFAVKHMPHLDVVYLEAGHAVNIGAADEFNMEVTSFITSHLKKIDRT